MPRPKTKQDLCRDAAEQYKRMWDMIDGMSDELQNATFHYGAEAGKEAHWGRDKNIRDVLVHLYEWHMLLLNWVAANQAGNPQPFLPAPYSWASYGDMNVGFWQMHQNTSYAAAKQMVQTSHEKVMQLIEGFSDEELFTKNHFTWTGGSTLGQYCISATVAHYEWAMKKLKLHLKTAAQ